MSKDAHHKPNAFAAETAVMDLWDSGLSAPAIADHLGKPLTFVRRILCYMGAHEDPVAPIIAMRAASSQLVAAIHRERTEP